MTLKETFFGTRTRTFLTLGGVAALVVLVAKRKKVAAVATEAAETIGEAAEAAGAALSTAATSAQLAAVRLLMPKGTEYIADLAFEIGPKYGVSPYVILGITYSESNFGRALRPEGPGGTGDFIPRSPGRCVQVDAKGKCAKTLQQLVTELSFPIKTDSAGQLVPTTRGWGHGLYQIDLMFHHPFIATGKWADPRAAMDYAVKLFASYRDQIKKAVPSIGPLDLVRASVAAYNAGAGAVIKALKAGVPADKLDQGALRSKGGTRVTFHEGYVTKVLNKGSSMEPANVA